MPVSAQLPWKILRADSRSSNQIEDGADPVEVQTATTVQLLQRRSLRRSGSAAQPAADQVAKDVTERSNKSACLDSERGAGLDDLQDALNRLAKDLKGQLADMDKKLDGLDKKLDRSHEKLDKSHEMLQHAAPPPPQVRAAPAPRGPPAFLRSNTLTSLGSATKIARTRSLTKVGLPRCTSIEDKHEPPDADVPYLPGEGGSKTPTGRQTPPGTTSGRVGEGRRLSTARFASDPSMGRTSGSGATPMMPSNRRSSEVAVPPPGPPPGAGPPTGAPAWLPMEVGLHRCPSIDDEHPMTEPAVLFHCRDLDEKDEAAKDKLRSERTSEDGEADKERRNSGTSSASSRIGNILRAKMLSVHVRRSQMSQDIWQFLEETDSSRASIWFARAMQILVVMNVMISVVQSQEEPMLQGNFPIAVQLFFDLVFTVEMLTRFVVCPNRMAFFISPFNWVDIISACMVVPRVLSIFLPKSEPAGRSIHEFLHLIVPVVWLLKLLRSFEKFHLLYSAFIIASEALPVLLFTLTIIVLTFAAMIYYVEPRENIEALPRAIWLTLVTMTTVGYGDIVPKTSAGNIVVSALIIGSQLYMAIPLGIVGGSFSRVWEDREHLLLIRRTRTRLVQWGYTPQDILELFYIYDQEKTGELDLYDFSRMMKEMRLGLDPQRIQNLFKSFDADGSGKVDHEEFVSVLYPNCGLFAEVDGPDKDGPSIQQMAEGSCVSGSCVSSRRDRGGRASCDDTTRYGEDEEEEENEAEEVDEGATDASLDIS